MGNLTLVGEKSEKLGCKENCGLPVVCLCSCDGLNMNIT